MVETLPRPARDAVLAALAGISRRRPGIVGVSGGRDSVLLLHVLAGCGFRKLFAAHLDHGLRGRSGGADRTFVERLAARLGCGFFSGRADVRALAKEHGGGIENAGRRARAEFFAQVARETGARTLFLGHHADDRAETVLHHCLRGTGLGGLGSLRARSERRAGRLRLGVVRPLIGVWREEINAVIAAAGVRYREDASNVSREFTRNRVRHEILPFLEEVYGRDVRGALWRLGEIAGADDDWLGEESRRCLATLSSGKTGLPAGKLAALPLALQRRVILLWLRESGVENIGWAEVEAVRGLAEKISPAKVNLPGDRHARRKAGRISLSGGGR